MIEPARITPGGPDDEFECDDECEREWEWEWQCERSRAGPYSGVGD